MFKMKAISPMIAVVLLIAFTIGVGGLVSIFATGLTTTSTGVTQNQSTSLSKCAGAWINVYRVTNSTIFYQNPTSQPITGLAAIFSDGKSSVTVLDQNLTAGEANFTEITNETSSRTGVGFAGGSATAVLTGIAPGAAPGNTSVVLRGLCQNAVTVEGTCRNGQVCWQSSTA